MRELLELYVITYNRAALLEQTLRALAVEPIQSCKVTVLDNHSTDSTNEVCKRAKEWLPALQIVRHGKNIGGDANNLRAIEMATAPYTWILCDDDEIDLSNASDVWATIREERADIISLGIKDSNDPLTGYQRLGSIPCKGHFLFKHTFTPAAILRTALCNDQCMIACYKNLGSLFPQFPLFERALREDALAYFSPHTIISKGRYQGYSPFRFLAGWLMSVRTVHDAALRRDAVEQLFGRTFWKNFSYALLIERKLRKDSHESLKALYGEAWRTSTWLGLKVTLAGKCAHLPQWAIDRLWNWYAEFKTRHSKPQPVCDEAR
jgi:glycosyltransferase involved in cell wall biosynthesis